jgi:trimeric autotransporter adhesin
MLRRRHKIRAPLIALLSLLALAGSAAAAEGAGGRTITVAGTGAHGYSGDNGPATSARLFAPDGVARLPGGAFLIADTDNNVIRKVSPSGRITTVAGNGRGGYEGDNGPATKAHLDQPDTVSPLPGGGFLIADTVNSVIRRVSAQGMITTVAGTGMSGYGGDNGPAVDAKLFFPQSVAALPGGGFLIADTDNERIREVSPAGQITTVAGNGTFGFAGDRGPATSAELALPTGVSVTPDGFLIADSDNDRIREVSSGTITTVAGNGTIGYSGDGGAATRAEMRFPKGVSAQPDGGFLVADTQNDAIRRISPAGRISTVAGKKPPPAARAGQATSTRLNMPNGVAALANGGFLIADTEANRIRKVSPPG